MQKVSQGHVSIYCKIRVRQQQPSTAPVSTFIHTPLKFGSAACG